MKQALLFTAALIVGFSLAVVTPLGRLASPTAIQNFFGEMNLFGFFKDTVSEELAPQSLSQFRQLIATATREPEGNILQNEEIVLAAGFIDPEEAWSMSFAEIAVGDGVTRAALSSDIVAPEEIKRGEAGGGNIGQSAPDLASDERIWRSRTSAMELDRLHGTIAGIRAENEAIGASLAQTEVTHPDYHMSLCVRASNNGLIAFYDFLIRMGVEGASLEDTEALTKALLAEEEAIAGHIKSGRTTAAAYAQVLKSLPATSEEEKEIKSLALEYYDSFLLSFDVEETLAAHLAAYPGLIAAAIETGKPPFEVSAWVRSFQELGRSRMELQAFRQSITQQLAGPNA